MSSARSTVSRSRRPSPLCVLLLALLLSPHTSTTGLAASGGLAVYEMASDLLDVEPGSTVTASFTVANRSGRRVAILEEITLPRGWRLIVGESTLELSPGEERLRLVTLHVPMTAPAGSYTLVYEVTGQGQGALHCIDEIEITVLPFGRIEIIERDLPARVIAGDTLSARVSIVNHGNADTGIQICVASSESYPISVDASEFFLGAGESRDVTVSVETDGELARRAAHVLTVEATASDLHAAEAATASTIVQEIIPRVSGRHDPYHRVPIVLRSVYLGGDDGEAGQLDISGGGRLSERGGHTIGFVLRGPDTRNASVFGRRDEYGLVLQGPGHVVRVGDAVYGLSRLTGQRRDGRGASLELVSGRWEASGSYFGTPTGEPGTEKGIARLTHHPTDRASVGLGYVKTEPDGHVLSVEASHAVARWLDIDAEYAQQVAPVERRAYWTRVRGGRGRFRYFLERIRADEGFTGRFSDEHHTTGSVSLPVFRELRLNSFYRDYENRDVSILVASEADETTVSSTTREEARGLGLKTPLWSEVRATADYRDVRRGGRTATTAFDYRTRTTRLAIELARSTVSTVGSLELGRLDDVSTGVTSGVTRYALTVSLKPGGGWHLSGHFKSALFGSPDPSNSSDAAGVRAELAIPDWLTLAAGAQWRGFGDGAAIDPNEVTVSGSYRLPSRHRVTAELRRTRFDAGCASQMSLRVGYEIPIEAAVGRRTSTGSLGGAVFDAEDPIHPGIEGVVLTLNGLTAVTDRRGEYLFPSIEPGEYYLTVDPASIGRGRLPATGLPTGFEIFGGGESRFDLGVTRSGSLGGEVLLDRAPTGRPDGLANAVPIALPALLVEATSGGEALRQLTDGQGRFSFRRLRPGRWVLTIHADGLPRFHDLENDTFVVDVLPGTTQRIRARVRSHSYAIPIIETGDIRKLAPPR